MKPDTAPPAPTPAVAIGSKAVPQPAKAPTTPATGIGGSKFIYWLEKEVSNPKDIFYLSGKVTAQPFFVFYKVTKRNIFNHP